MTYCITLVTNTEDVFLLASTEINKNNSYIVIAQSRLGKKLIVQNAKLVVALDVMSDVMISD